MKIFKSITLSLLAWCACFGKKTVMVFGVFDLLHPGHNNFLAQAQNEGDKLIAVVTRDTIVVELKKRMPINSQKQRLLDVKKNHASVRVILGDKKLGAYAVIKKYKPSIICLGYDQEGFGKHLRESMEAGVIPMSKIKYMKPFMPTLYHTSLLRKSLGL